VLKAYGEAVGANFEVWRFATGTKEAIGALTRAFAVYTERNGVTLDHTLCTALIGTFLRGWRRCTRIEADGFWKAEPPSRAMTPSAPQEYFSPRSPRRGTKEKVAAGVSLRKHRSDLPTKHTKRHEWAEAAGALRISNLKFQISNAR
jgi:hypothetical protein